MNLRGADDGYEGVWGLCSTPLGRYHQHDHDRPTEDDAFHHHHTQRIANVLLQLLLT